VHRGDIKSPEVAGGDSGQALALSKLRIPEGMWRDEPYRNLSAAQQIAQYFNIERN
jgi:hypothetical protein